MKMACYEGSFLLPNRSAARKMTPKTFTQRFKRMRPKNTPLNPIAATCNAFPQSISYHLPQNVIEPTKNRKTADIIKSYGSQSDNSDSFYSTIRNWKQIFYGA